MTVRYYPGTTDPDLSARANAPTAQAAESMPAVLREQERIAFKDAHRPAFYHAQAGGTVRAEGRYY